MSSSQRQASPARKLARELSQVEFDGGGLLSARLSQVAEQIGDLFMGRRR